MFDMIPSRKNYSNRKNEYFSTLDKDFFDDDLFSSMNLMQGNFKVDLKETDKSYLVEAELPGVKKEAIDIDYDNNHLVISAIREEILEDKKENYVRRERHYGQFKRSFYVDNINENEIKACFSDGVLKITLPKIAKDLTRKRKIDIQ